MRLITTFTLLLISTALFTASTRAATDTPGKASVSFTTETYGGVFAEKSFVAAWVTDQAGTFIKTLYVRCTQPFGGRLNHLVAWTASSGQNYTDAVTGATVMAHGRHDIEWDCTDTTGSTVVDGIYRVRLEFTEDNSNNSGQPDGPITPVGFLEFTKGVSGITITPSGAANYTGVSLDYVPNVPIAAAGNDIEIADSDGTGYETVSLNGSASSDPNGTITEYRWLESAIELATGVTANVELSVDTHTITLEVTDNDGNTDTDALTVLVRPVDYDSTLVAHWKFSAAGTPADSTGNGHDGTFLSGAAWTAFGRIGGASEYDGANDYMSVPNSDTINTAIHGERTVTAWIRASDPAVSSRKQIVYEEGGAARGLAIYLFNGLLYCGGWNDDADESNWSGTYLSTSNVVADQWHHVAMVLNGTVTTTPDAFSAYLDGMLIGSGEGSQLWGHSDAIGIGGLNGGTLLHDDTESGSHGFAGRIDDVRIYNRDLSATDIGFLARNDLDRDEMPDDWEREFTDATVMLPDEDDDGDGLSNLAEYRADTNPTNGASALRLTGINMQGGLLISWQGGTDSRQRLEYMEGAQPAATGWTQVILVDPPTPAVTNVLIPHPPTYPRFYRIRAERP